MSTNQNQPAVGKFCSENICKYDRYHYKIKCVTYAKKVHILCAKRLRSDNSLVCCSCHKLIRDEARREKRQLADAHRCSNKSVPKRHWRQQSNNKSTERSREAETAEDTQLRQQCDKSSTSRSRETETAEDTRLNQQRNKESTARSIETETVDETQLRQQCDSKPQY